MPVGGSRPPSSRFAAYADIPRAPTAGQLPRTDQGSRDLMGAGHGE